MMPPSEQQLKAIARGTVVVVNLDPAEGAEQKKTRPCVVISADTINARLNTLIVVPISSKKDRDPYPHEVFVRKGEGGLTLDSLAQPVQVRTIDRRGRVVSILGRLPPQTMAQISLQLFVVLGGLP